MDVSFVDFFQFKGEPRTLELAGTDSFPFDLICMGEPCALDPYARRPISIHLLGLLLISSQKQTSPPFHKIFDSDVLGLVPFD